MDYNEITNRIDELNLDGYKHIKNNDWKIPKRLISWLENNNFSLKGKGMYSNVFQSPTENFVVKINKGYIDKGYVAFVDFCHQNKGNRHLPKIGKIKKYENWYIVFIENLEESDNFDMDDMDEIAGYIEDLILKPDSHDKTMKEINNSFSSQDIKTQISECADILGKFLEKGYASDLHGGNIMFRGDTIVITDPVI